MSILVMVGALIQGSHAAGYYAGSPGIRPLGRGGAAFVGSDDLAALSYNPAALIRIDTMVHLQLAAINQAVTFDRTGDEESTQPVHNEAAPLPIPHIGVATSFGREDLTIALGLKTPYAPFLEFQDGGPQRYTLVDSEIINLTAGPSVAWQPTPGLSFGASVGWSMLSMDQTLDAHISPAAFAPDEDANFDVHTRIQVTDPFKIAWNIGVLYEPTEGRWATGLSYTPAVHFIANGSMDNDFSDNHYYTGAGNSPPLIGVNSATDPDVTLALSMPAVIGGGVMFNPTPTTNIEVNLVWEGWQALETVILQSVDLAIPSASEDGDDLLVSDDVVLPLSLQDSWAVRIGATLAASEAIDVRAGVFGETSAASTGYRSVLIPDGEKVGYGTGFTYKPTASIAVDFAFSQSFVPQQDLTGSQVYQLGIEPLMGTVEPGVFVGNGSFSVTNTIAGIGINWTPGTQ